MREIREAAKRLCRWADENGPKALPRPGQVVELRKGKQSQHVRLARAEGGWFWLWLWEPFRGVFPVGTYRSGPYGRLGGVSTAFFPEGPLKRLRLGPGRSW